MSPGAVSALWLLRLFSRLSSGVLTVLWEARPFPTTTPPPARTGFAAVHGPSWRRPGLPTSGCGVGRKPTCLQAINIKSRGISQEGASPAWGRRGALISAQAGC